MDTEEEAASLHITDLPADVLALIFALLPFRKR